MVDIYGLSVGDGSEEDNVVKDLCFLSIFSFGLYKYGISQYK